VTTGSASLVALAVAGCTSSSSSGDAGDRPEPPAVGEDPDRDLLLDALGAEESLHRLVTRVRRQHRALRDLLAGTERVHAAHVVLLSGAVQGDRESPAPERWVADGPRQALTELRKAERALAGSHAGTAMAASSGTFARLMAGMSAAAAQQERVLSQASVPKGGRAS
jgi:hypothetical protein